MSAAYSTSLGASDLHSIRLLGTDMPTELMGEVPFGDLAFWMVALRQPTRGESRLFNAVLVALVDHGFTPSAIAARMTVTGAPESIQGAMASGLLGAGSRFLGVTEDAAAFLADGLAHTDTAHEPPAYDTLARNILNDLAGTQQVIPGLGYPVHKRGDPRTPVIYQIAAEEGLFGPHLSLLAAIERVHPELLGKTLPVNGAGVCGAALSDLGFSPNLGRGFAVLARTAGLLGHIAEEIRDPIGPRLYQEVDRNTNYVTPETVAHRQ